MLFIQGDAGADFLADSSVDLIVTSPPYWKKRNYGLKNELGQEAKKKDYIERLVSICAKWKRILKPHGSVFINLGDGFQGGALQNIPGEFSLALQKHLNLIHHIIWSKPRTMPSPAKKRLNHTHEDILHFAVADEPFLNFGEFTARYGSCGNFWEMATARTGGDHLAPFPLELVERCAALALPEGGILFDPFVGSGTAFELESSHPSIKTIGCDLRLYERTRRLLFSPRQRLLF